jgi:hypothetical protein
MNWFRRAPYTPSTNAPHVESQPAPEAPAMAVNVWIVIDDAPLKSGDRMDVIVKKWNAVSDHFDYTRITDCTWSDRGFGYKRDKYAAYTSFLTDEGYRPVFVMSVDISLMTQEP